MNFDILVKLDRINIKTPGNICFRCGKQRILVRTWQKREGNSVLTYTTTSCPDSLCQEEVDKLLAVAEAKREALKDLKQQRSFPFKSKV